MIKKLIKYLYIRFVDPDVVGMTRHQLGYFNEPQIYNNLTDQQQEDFVSKAIDLKANEVLASIMDEVIAQTKDQVFHRSDENQIIMDRFTLNGVYLVKEKIEYYASLSRDNEEEFDKHALL